MVAGSSKTYLTAEQITRAFLSSSRLFHVRTMPEYDTVDEAILYTKLEVPVIHYV